MSDNSTKNFSYITSGRIISSALLAIFYLIFAAILAPSDYGQMGYLIALSGTFSVVSRFGLPQTITIYLAKGNRQLSNQLTLLAVITTSAASIILAFIDEFSALLCIGLTLFFLFQHNLLGEKRYKDFMKDSILRSVLIFAIPFPLYLVLGVPGIILGMAIGNMTSGLWIAKYLTLNVKSFKLIKNNLKVLVNNFGVDASSNLVRWVDRLLVGAVFGFLSLGIYHFNMQILYAIEILPRALYIFLLSEESSGKKHKKISYMVVLASSLIVIAVILFSPFVIENFFPNYTDGIMSLQIIIISLIPIAVSYIITAKMQAVESSKVGYSAIVRIGSLLILLSVLGNAYGLIGFSLSVLISSILNTIFLYFLYKYTKTRNDEVNQIN
ncbi:MAG TPA: oligosaccharide flippase family protein [Nitrosopumilaceae archaeon]|nr:oligosaccharide flippase family protein [Nitrosopumilaceae archaeon]